MAQGNCREVGRLRSWSDQDCQHHSTNHAAAKGRLPAGRVHCPHHPQVDRRRPTHLPLRYRNGRGSVMTSKQYREQIESDARFWNVLADLMGWRLQGFSWRHTATYLTNPPEGDSLQIN